MDIVGKETLENMLISYQGTVVVVSHDRYFINKVADKLLVFKGDGVEFYPYGYAEYDMIEKEKTEKELAEKQPSSADKTCSKNGGKKTFSTPLKDKSRKERRVQKLEQLIADNTSKIEELNGQLENPDVYSDYVKVTEIQKVLEQLQKETDEYSEEWLKLSEELENIV
jgi:ATP-binding cassette subfamily F protein 3